VKVIFYTSLRCADDVEDERNRDTYLAAEATQTNNQHHIIIYFDDRFIRTIMTATLLSFGVGDF